MLIMNQYNYFWQFINCGPFVGKKIKKKKTFDAINSKKKKVLRIKVITIFEPLNDVLNYLS